MSPHRVSGNRQTRRAFLGSAGRLTLGAAGLALLVGCGASPGQGRGGASAGRVATVGYLRAVTDEVEADDASLRDELRRGLRELGWLEGENLRLEVRLSQGDPAVLPALAAELIHLPVDVIVAVSGPAVSAPAAATSTLPVVMVRGSAATIRQGLAESIQHPGGNVTGTLAPPSETFGKRLELLVEAVPHIARVACIGQASRSIRLAVGGTAQALGVRVEFWSVQSEQDLEMVFGAVSGETADAVLVGDTAVTFSNRARIVAFAAQRRLPVMYEARHAAEVGGLMSYGPSLAELYRRAAFYVDRILRGAQPGDLPIEYPARYELLINLRTAEALGLAIPDSLLAQASEVIR